MKLPTPQMLSELISTLVGGHGIEVQASLQSDTRVVCGANFNSMRSVDVDVLTVHINIPHDSDAKERCYDIIDPNDSFFNYALVIASEVRVVHDHTTIRSTFRLQHVKEFMEELTEKARTHYEQTFYSAVDKLLDTAL